ncbi:MAG: hypothetical protein JWM91_1234 [Rhodospirillales bacterium]|nr:hypothetical protein [Rhodospirillales bacterium]
MADDSPPPREGPLKLRAVDTEDLAVLAAFLQDSIANVSEMAYLPEQRVFALAVCRFRWERLLTATPEAVFERVSCAVTISGVDTPKYRGFSLKDRGRTMPLLTMTFDEAIITLTFGGDGAVRLPVAGLDVRIEDFGECWPTTTKPQHGNTSL